MLSDPVKIVKAKTMPDMAVLSVLILVFLAMLTTYIGIKVGIFTLIVGGLPTVSSWGHRTNVIQRLQVGRSTVSSG